MPTGIESRLIAAGGTIIELLAAVVIAFHACRALGAILKRYDADRPRLIIADGVLAALGFSVAGTLLKALALQNWQQIGMFAFVLALRTLLKQVFKRERKQIAERRLAS
ncbi:MAG: DUF1622 domain-containing protein [Acidobacteriaceae bacterium]|nr:DUF1622 domain-containing protein [Acidobacteriaceae bacterium]MBV9307445.1 DUF1622 domain-containing protein [Acidobacteriaceae bacterium]MBV9678899.1 DUF1622 domain-containing protein [Acidobacteriaceae bacterium]MBV9939178.1 DUF1622 domain-containing protein [Acidobacteriaceae bacterium]